MSGNVYRSFRRVAAGLALVATVFSATVLVWHVAYRPATAIAEARLLAGLGVICHGGGSALDDRAARSPADPTPDSPECPICQGLGALWCALVPPAIGLAALPAERASAVILADVATNGAAVAEPRNRGPPRHD